jgi:hypothetical protein
MKSHTNSHHPKQQQWVSFENEVYEQVKTNIDQHRLMLDPRDVKVHQKKGYYSKDREKDIIFDVVVEAFAAATDTPSLIWIWECKDYPDRKVSVDEVEEFFSKLLQIGLGSVKGTIVTRVGFEAGAEAYAKSQRIGLAVLHKELHAVTHYEKGGIEYEVVRVASPYGILLSGKEYREPARLYLDSIVEIEMRNLGLLPALPC